MEKSKIKNRRLFAFPDLLDISAKKKPQIEACWSSAASLLVLWEGALEGKTILECSGISIIPYNSVRWWIVWGIVLKLESSPANLNQLKWYCLELYKELSLQKIFQWSCFITFRLPLMTLGLERRGKEEGQNLKRPIFVP